MMAIEEQIRRGKFGRQRHIAARVNQVPLSLSTPNQLSATQQFLLWGEATLRGANSSGDANAARPMRIDAPSSHPPTAHAAGFDLAASHSPENLLQCIVRELQARGRYQHAAPRRQPSNIEELAPAITAAYNFVDGQVQLAAAELADQPILRLTQVQAQNGLGGEVQHSYYWPDGEELDETLVRQLQLDDLVPWLGDPPPHEPLRVGRWIDACRVRQRKHPVDGDIGQTAIATLVWCKRLTGKVVLTAGDTAVAVPLAGWAERFTAGDEEPPAYRCPLTGIESHRLGVTSDGRIVPRVALAVCEESQRVGLAGELAQCAATGRRVHIDLLGTCMATGQRVLRKLLTPCNLCAQPVAPSALRAGRCSACRRLAEVRSDDPRMARVHGEYPKLDRWRRWRMAETESTYVLSTRSLVRQVLLVVHKETLTVLYAAVAGRIWSPWQEMSQLQRDDLLG